MEIHRRHALLAALSLAACRARSRAGRRDVPVLLAHGMYGDRRSLEAIARHLRSAGFLQVEPITLAPVDGSVSVAPLAAQLDVQARALIERTRAERIDVVGYSLGALVARYWLQRLRGRERTRRFISLAGPQNGVVGGALPVAALSRDLRPVSDLYGDLARDPDPWGATEVASFFSPFDLVIVPAHSAILPRSTLIHAFAVPTHHQMSTHPSVLSAIEHALGDREMTLPTTVPAAGELEGELRRIVAERSLRRP